MSQLIELSGRLSVSFFIYRLLCGASTPMLSVQNGLNVSLQCSFSYTGGIKHNPHPYIYGSKHQNQLDGTIQEQNVVRP